MFQFFPVTLLITLILTPLVWRLNYLKKEKDKVLALREDAYTKGLLALLVNADPDRSAEFRQKMIGKFFEHNSQHNTSEIIANWNKKDSTSANTIIEKVVEKANPAKEE